MKKLFSFPKKKKHSSGTPDSGSVLSASYELKEKDLGKVHKAALAGDLAKLKQLAKKNDINQLDKENRTALHIACACGHVELVQFLVDNKAKLNLCDNQNRSALMKAVQVQNERCVSILLENHADPKLVDINGNTALHLAANIPSISTVMVLLEYEADINASNKECFTPLTVAVRENHYEMAEFLLKEGADVNFIDHDQRSILMIAAGSGQMNMLRLLLQFDADSTLKDSKGWSADNYAEMNGHHACSVLIIDNGRHRTDVPSLLHQGPNSNTKKNVLSGPSCRGEASFSLGGPATDKPENGANEAGKDLEDTSQSDSLSRVSKSLGDDWSSSEEDDESVLNQKKLPKLNLKEMIAFKKREASRKPDKSLSDTESDLESENRVQKTPSFLKSVASNTNSALQGSVDPSPSSSFKQHQTTSSPLPIHIKKNSTDDNDVSDKEEAGDEVESEISDENHQIEEGGNSPDAISAVAEKENPKNMERDFLSELGLEKEEEEQDSWDSESASENSSNVHGRNQIVHADSQEKLSNVEEVVKKDLFYVPSFIRGDGGNRMAVLELRRSVGRTRGSQGVVENKASDEHVVRDDAVYTEMKKPKWDPLSVLNKCDGDTDRKIDVMEELGLGDADDLEDPSEWDSASTASKKSLPGCRMASPEFKESPQLPNPSVEQQKQDISASAPLPSQRTINSENSLPSASHSKLHPQPHARKLVIQKSEGEEEPDLEPDSLTSAFDAAKPDNQPQTVADPPAVVGPGSPVVSKVARDDTGIAESTEQHLKEKVSAVETGVFDLNGPCAADSGQKADAMSDECSPRERGLSEDVFPWEKRYEKLWVEVEKREMKSNFRNVAGELKEKFGELFKSDRNSAEDLEEEQPIAESVSEEEEAAASDEEDEEVIARPSARARSISLLTIPEQRESGLEDSVTESNDSSQCEDIMHNDSRENDACRDSDPPFNERQEECISSPLQGFTSAHRDSNTDPAATEFADGHSVPRPDADSCSFLKMETRCGLSQQPAQNHVTASQHEAEKGRETSETQSQPPSCSTYSVTIPRVSDEELEEDMERFKHETGRETTKTAVELQKSVDFSSTMAKESEGMAVEKPEIKLGWQKEQSAHSNTTVMEEQPAAIHSVNQRDKSTNGDSVQWPLPLKQTCKSMRKEGQGIAVEETLQQELPRGTQGGRASKVNAHVNGTSLSVFEDSTLSDMSDDEGRLPSGDQQKHEKSGEMEMTEDLDELTQSSDTATDDMDSPTSGYRHASLLIQNLDSATLDSRTMVKLQNIFHEYERSIQKARSRHGYLADKVSQLELERTEMKSSLEEVKDLKSALERTQLELHTEITNLKFQLKQEQENRRNATMMYNTTKDKLRRAEEQQQLEFQERQKVELTFRNLELEMRTLVNNMKQLEEDHSETQRLLAQERSARTLQENLLNNHLRKQQEIEVENKRNLSKSHEALSQLTEASDREKELLQQIATLQEQLSILKLDLERSQANSELKEHLVEENEALKEQLEDVRRDLKLNDRAHAETIFNCNNQLTTFKSELAKATAGLENEKQTRETLDSEVQSSRNRLAVALQEVERHMAAQADTEKRLLRENEEHQRLKDKFTAEAASQREAVNSLSQKLTKAEANTNSMENEVHRVTLQLTEKSLLLDVLQREKEQAAARAKEFEVALQAERELVGRSGARQEAAQERLAQAQSDTILLRQQLEEAQNKGVAKDRAVTDAQERFSDILSKLRSDSEDRVQLVEERNKELATKAADLREQVYKLEEEKNEREASLRQLQQELADSLKKLSMSEASLEVNTHYRNDLEEEKARLSKDVERLRRKLEESEDQYMEAEKRIKALKSVADEKENQITMNAQKLQEALSAAAISEVTSKQLEEAVQRLEIENARLEAAAKQQSNQIDALQKTAQESTAVRNHLEGLVTNLQSSKMSLEDQLSQEVQKQGLFNTSQDSKALWEEELKCRSKLGLRMAELEKEKGELSNQMEVEKKKVKKIAEQKKAVDTRLDQEMKRNTELQKEMYRLRTLLKTAKKKLRDPDTSGGEFGSAMSRDKMEFNRYNHDDGAFGRMREKVELEKESSRCRHLEKVNGELQDELASLKSLKHSNDQLEMSKRKLEEEVLDLKRRAEAAQIEQRQAEQYCLDVKERARQEIQQKLEQVNLFLQSQAASQEALDQIKAANEATLRSQLEQKLRELDGELGRARTTHQEILNQKDSTRTELGQYRQLYSEEVRLRKSMATKLERANARLADANSKLLDERSKSVIANSSLRGSLLDGGSFSSITNSGAILGPPNRSIGLSLLNPVNAGQSSRVEDYLAEMQKELDRNVSKELNRATAELDAGSTRLSPVGSASRTELDPISRATQQYLEVLKKNKMI